MRTRRRLKWQIIMLLIVVAVIAAVRLKPRLLKVEHTALSAFSIRLGDPLERIEKVLGPPLKLAVDSKDNRVYITHGYIEAVHQRRCSVCRYCILIHTDKCFSACADSSVSRIKSIQSHQIEVNSEIVIRVFDDWENVTDLLGQPDFTGFGNNEKSPDSWLHHYRRLGLKVLTEGRSIHGFWLEKPSAKRG